MNPHAAWAKRARYYRRRAIAREITYWVVCSTGAVVSLLGIWGFLILMSGGPQ